MFLGYSLEGILSRRKIIDSYQKNIKYINWILKAEIYKKKKSKYVIL